MRMTYLHSLILHCCCPSHSQILLAWHARAALRSSQGRLFLLHFSKSITTPACTPACLPDLLCLCPLHSQMLHAWHAAAALRSSRGRLLLRHVSKAATTHLRTTLSAWRRAATTRRQLSRTAGLLLTRSRHAHHAAAFAAWRAVACCAVARATAAGQALKGHQQRQARSALADWRLAARVRRTHRATLLRHTARMGYAVLRETFLGWRTEVETAAARVEALRTCIRRKRIAFQQFKQWYWTRSAPMCR